MDTLLLVGLGVILYLIASQSSAQPSPFTSVLPTIETDISNLITPYSGSGAMTPQQIAGVAQNAGWSGPDLVTAVAIAYAESSGIPSKIGTLGVGSDWGLWQINDHYHPEFGPNYNALLDPQTNANAAFQVYQVAGNSFTPWATYPTIYLNYLPTVQAALGA
jgi:hypothetical protein